MNAYINKPGLQRKGDGVILKKTAPPHKCRLPQGRMAIPLYAPGSIWQCDICGQHYLSREGFVAGYWKWISPRKAKKLLNR